MVVNASQYPNVCTKTQGGEVYDLQNDFQNKHMCCCSYCVDDECGLSRVYNTDKDQYEQKTAYALENANNKNTATRATGARKSNILDTIQNHHQLTSTSPPID